MNFNNNPVDSDPNRVTRWHGRLSPTQERPLYYTLGS